MARRRMVERVRLEDAGRTGEREGETRGREDAESRNGEPEGQNPDAGTPNPAARNPKPGPRNPDTGSRSPRPRFYERVLTQEEIAALAGMAEGLSLSEEIDLLRVLIRRKLEEGTDLATISKAVDALARALKVQKQISDESHRALQDALVAVLKEMDGETGSSKQ